jgi:hypothetical protein
MLGWPPPVGAPHGRRAATMKSLKRIAVLLLAGFLAFAPPGTMILLLALVVGFAGRRWAAGAAAVCLGAAAALLLLRFRRRRARSRAIDAARPDTD